MALKTPRLHVRRTPLSIRDTPGIQIELGGPDQGLATTWERNPPHLDLPQKLGFFKRLSHQPQPWRLDLSPEDSWRVSSINTTGVSAKLDRDSGHRQSGICLQGTWISLEADSFSKKLFREETGLIWIKHLWKALLGWYYLILKSLI